MILVIGGSGDEGGSNKLSPLVINIGEEGHASVEKCTNRKGFKKIDYAQGQFLDGSLVICPQKSQKCTVIGTSTIKTIKMKKNRLEKAIVKLNDSTMWITGNNGYDSSTEFITINGSTKGIDFPFAINRHCMVKYKPNFVLMIGGFYKKDDVYEYNTRRTWIVDIENDFNITDGPFLKEGRMQHSCGTTKDIWGNVLAVVSSGQTVEILNTTTMEEWEYGEIILIMLTAKVLLKIFFSRTKLTIHC